MRPSTVEVLLLAAFIVLASGAHIRRRAVTEDVGIKAGGGGGGGGGGFGGGEDGSGGGSGAGFGGGYGGNDEDGRKCETCPDDEEAGIVEDGQICETCYEDGGEGFGEKGEDDDEGSDAGDDEGGKDDDIEAGGDDSCGSVLCISLRKNEFEKRKLGSLMKVPDLANEQPPIWVPNARSLPKNFYYSYYSYSDGHENGLGEIENAIERPIHDISNIVTVIPWVFANNFNRGIQMKITPIYPEPMRSLAKYKTLMGSSLLRFKRDEGTDLESSNDEQEESGVNEEKTGTSEGEEQTEVKEGEEEAGEGDGEGEVGGEEVGEIPIEGTELIENESPNEEGLAEESHGEEENEEGNAGEEGGETEELGDTDEEMTEEGEDLMQEAEDEESVNQAEIQEEENEIEDEAGDGEIEGEAGGEPANTGVGMEMLSVGSDGGEGDDYELKVLPVEVKSDLRMDMDGMGRGQLRQPLKVVLLGLDLLEATNG